MQAKTFTASSTLDTASRKVIGYSVSASGAAYVIIRDGGSSGPGIIHIRFAGADSDTFYFAGAGLDFHTDVYADVQSGTVAGTVWLD